MKNTALPDDLSPADDTARLAELRSYAVLYTAAEEAFDNLAQIMALAFAAPLSFISLVDVQTVFYKAQAGNFGRTQVCRPDSLCSLTILTPAPTVFEDTWTEAVLQTNPIIRANGGLRFYAGAPLITPNGYRIGAVCVMDSVPRSFSAANRQLLERFARQAMHELTVRKNSAGDVAEQIAARRQIELSEARYRQLAEDLDKRVQQRTQTLHESNLDLQRSNQNLEQFAYIASHDLQEPLRKIQSFSGILKAQYGNELGEYGNDILNRLASGGARMSLLINDLLSFSRITTHRVPAMPVPLASVMSEALENLSVALAETTGQVHYETLPTVQGDASQLVQLFQNLLANALKFHQDGVPPLVRIQSSEVPAAEMPTFVNPTWPAPAYYHIEVTDHGIGFDERYAGRIFQVFQRLHGKSQFAGTGIGLAICEKVVINHGGAIAARSQPGEGATFSVYLPVPVSQTPADPLTGQ